MKVTIVSYKTSKTKNNNLVRQIESKLFDDLDFEKKYNYNENNNSVVLNIDSGEIIN